MIQIIQKIPVLTTLFSAVFFVVLRRHWLSRNRPPHLFWWTAGVLCYGLGTLTEALVALMGWREYLFKAWYILGALLGGFPLAQGSVFLLMKPRAARAMMWMMLAIIAITAAAVIASPVHYEWVDPTRLTGKVLVWKQIRWVTPIVNLYAFVFLVGGAAWSAYQYARRQNSAVRMWGNLLIATGGLLPGIGGSFTKFGYTEVLYVTELVGIVLIYGGYRLMRTDESPSLHSRAYHHG